MKTIIIELPPNWYASQCEKIFDTIETILEWRSLDITVTMTDAENVTVSEEER